MKPELLHKLADRNFYVTDMEGEWVEGIFRPTLSCMIQAVIALDKERTAEQVGWFSMYCTPIHIPAWSARSLVSSGEGNSAEEAVANLWIDLHDRIKIK